MVLQRRSWVQTLLIVLMPIFFCLLLWGLEILVNNAFDTADNRVRQIVGVAICRSEPQLLSSRPGRACLLWQRCKSNELQLSSTRLFMSQVGSLLAAVRLLLQCMHTGH